MLYSSIRALQPLPDSLLTSYKANLLDGKSGCTYRCTFFLDTPELLVYKPFNATKKHTIAKAHAAKKCAGFKQESSAMATNTPLMAAQMNAQAECDPLNAIIEIAAERTSYLAGMKKALEVGDDKTLKHFAHKLCGMPTPAITSADIT